MTQSVSSITPATPVQAPSIHSSSTSPPSPNLRGWRSEITPPSIQDPLTTRLRALFSHPDSFAYLMINLRQGPDPKLHTLLDYCLPRWQLNAKQRKELIVKLKAFDSTKLASLITYYQSSDATPKAQLYCQGRHYLIDSDLALQMICKDCLGFKHQTNLHGRHAVFACNGIHFKPNPLEALASDYLNPAQEQAIATFCNLLSPVLIATPSTLLKLRACPLTSLVNRREQSDKASYDQFQKLRYSGLSTDEILKKHPSLLSKLTTRTIYTERTVQASYTAGHQKEGMLLIDLLACMETCALLKQKLGEEDFLDQWDHLQTLAETTGSNNPKALLAALQAFHHPGLKELFVRKNPLHTLLPRLLVSKRCKRVLVFAGLMQSLSLTKKLTLCHFDRIPQSAAHSQIP